jgi:transcription antitermination factor NusG
MKQTLKQFVGRKPATVAIMAMAGLCWSLSCQMALASPLIVQAGQSETQDSSVARSVGTIKAINGSSLTVTSDAGAESEIVVDSFTTLLRTEPGSKSLKDAKPIQLENLAVGDRVMVRGKIESGTKAITALTVIALKKADFEQNQQQQQADWQKHGVGGIVESVDPANHTVTLKILTMTDPKPLLIHVTDKTVLRRYSPDSVKFSDAKISTLQEIHAGDQLRARGTRSEDGKEFTADEVISGAFRNIAGTVNAVNAASNSLTVMDFFTKRAVTVNITPDSQLRNLPPMLAQRIAMRFKAAASGGAANTGGGLGGENHQQGAGQGDHPHAGQSSGQSGGAGGPGGREGGGNIDFQQILSRMPAASINDLKKGDVVMLVATQGANADSVTAITLLSGVDAILAASPTVSQASMLTPWNLSAPSGDSNP